MPLSPGSNLGLLDRHRTFQRGKRNNHALYRGIVMGPWVHSDWVRHNGRRLGSVDFAADTSKFYREKILLPFFEFHLKDKADPKLPEAYVFETGTNVWRQYPAWPPPGTKRQTLYFREAGGLTFESPSELDASYSYVSDPMKPVPFIGYTAPGVPEEYMVGDQRFAATRPDVLVYVTEPLDEDLTLAGPVSPRLFISTTGTDPDWVVKLIDVYPPERSTPAASNGAENQTDVGPPTVTLAGYQQLVRGEPFRGKFRRSFAKPEDFQSATQRAVRSQAQPSGVEVHVLAAPRIAGGSNLSNSTNQIR